MMLNADAAWEEYRSAALDWRDRWHSRIGLFGGGARQAYERMVRADIRLREALARMDDASPPRPGLRGGRPRDAVNDCSASVPAR